MEKKRKIAMEVRKGSFAEVEEMRKMIWNKEYKKGMVKVVKKGKLKEDRDEFE